MTRQSVVIARYGEISLKGKNRAEFERRLRRSVAMALRDFPHSDVERPRGRIIVRGIDDRRAAAEQTARVFGITSTSPGFSVATNDAEIRAAAVDLVAETLEQRGLGQGDGVTFKVYTRRADKRFPIPSMAFSKLVADDVATRWPGLVAQMKEPTLMIGIDIRPQEAFLYAERIRGPGGLPIGSTGQGLVLFSGGIDSPVAAWLAMKRGLQINLLHFHAPPFVGEASRQKVVDLARVLSRWAGQITLFVANFAPIQVAIRQNAPSSYRTLLYRRAMNLVASRIADNTAAESFITGEALGQVASQTLINLRIIEETANRMVLRPLITFDKEETIELARNIGTLEISQRPHPDCCTLFQPDNPKTRGDLDEVHEIEAKLDLEPLVVDAVAQLEMVRIRDGEVRDDGPASLNRRAIDVSAPESSRS